MSKTKERRTKLLEIIQTSSQRCRSVKELFKLFKTHGLDYSYSTITRDIKLLLKNRDLEQNTNGYTVTNKLKHEKSSDTLIDLLKKTNKLTTLHSLNVTTSIIKVDENYQQLVASHLDEYIEYSEYKGDYAIFLGLNGAISIHLNDNDTNLIDELIKKLK